MPMVTAHADVFRDWDALLGACTENASLVPGVDPLKAELEGLLAQARDLKIQQETLESQRQATTQKLDQAIEDGRESVRKLRAFAVVHLGTTNKILSQFGVRFRGFRKKKAPDTPPPTDNPTVATQGSEGMPPGSLRHG